MGWRGHAERLRFAASSRTVRELARHRPRAAMFSTADVDACARCDAQFMLNAALRGLATCPPPKRPPRTAFLVVDTESIPDGSLVAAVKYPGREPHAGGGDRAGPAGGTRQRARTVGKLRLPPGHVPDPGRGVRAARRKRLHAAGADVPRRAALPPAGDRQEVLARRVAYYKAKLVTFNGRGFDMPLLELAAYPLRHPGARLLPEQPQPLQRPDRPVRLVHATSARAASPAG